jgi:RNA polymerase sigma-70 factor, ECF subfamily
VTTPESTRRDNYLLERISRDDEKAFEILFRTYYQDLCGFAARFVRRLDIAEELVQNTFINLWEKRKTLSIHTSFKAYIYKAIKNACINHYQSERPVTLYDDEALLDDILRVPSFLDKIEENELRDAVNKAIELLPERRKQIYLLHRQEGLTYREIAHVLDISVNTVETQMMRALRSIRSHLSHFLLSVLYI